MTPKKSAPTSLDLATRSRPENGRRELLQQVEQLQQQLKESKAETKRVRAVTKQRTERTKDRLVEEERKQAHASTLYYRKKMLEMAARLQVEQDEQAGVVAPWKVCELCKTLWNHEEHVPRVLDCGHTFCEKCIEEKLFSERDSRLVICPFDGQQLKTTIERVNDFPKNYLALTM